MKRKVADEMARFYVEIVVTNNSDHILAENGYLDATEVRRQTIQGLVDPGATGLVLPQSLAKELGLPVKKQKVKVSFADGRSGLRSEVDEVRLELLGRDGLFTAMAEPKRDKALIGAIA